jgi:oxygen-independent coproporphyrinogen-3 oxidase
VLVGGVAARQRFVEHLLSEIALAAPSWDDPQPFDTVYFGGGTPSLLPASELARVLDACRAHLPIAPDAWAFLEANPEDVTPESCAAWRSLGVRTLSLGVQSFADDALRFLERHHTAAQARAAVEIALAAGFRTVSVDLIFGLPDQTADSWRRELETAVALAPGHLSCYQLTVHQRTRFGVRAARGQLSELPEEEQASLFDLAHRFLAEAGWPAYEVSNFARGPEQQSRHNRKYWDHTPYLGLGPSAHSFAGARRWWNELRTPRWEKRLAAGERPIEGEETLGPQELATEAVMLGLRTAAGINLDAFAARHGFDLLAANAALVARLTAEGKLVVGSGAQGEPRLLPTSSGLAVADGLAAAFSVPGDRDPGGRVP